MRITDVRAHALSSPIEPIQERSFHGGVRRLLKRDVVLVVVETAAGEQGFATIGASSSAMREFFADASQSTAADLMTGKVREALMAGEFDDIAGATERIDALDLPVRLESQAVAAIDIALYDIFGKRHGASVAELLADGTVMETLPLYASAGMYMEPEGYVEQATILADCGFTGYKYRPGIGPARDRETVERLAQSVGGRTAIMLDSHTWWKMNGESYGRATVRELVEHAGRHDVYWVEEPVEPDDYTGYRELESVGPPLAGGESEASPAGLRALADTGAIRYLQGDVRHHRGITGCHGVAKAMAGTPIQFVPHNFGTWLGLIANAHVVAAAPEAGLLEYPVFENDPVLSASPDPGMYPFELAFDILEDDPDISDGELRLPEGPGLGVSVDLDIIQKYPFEPGAWTEFEYT